MINFQKIILGQFVEWALVMDREGWIPYSFAEIVQIFLDMGVDDVAAMEKEEKGGKKVY